MVNGNQKRLNVAIVHHHLNPGGVTKVIQAQIKSLLAFNISIDLIVGAAPIEEHPIYDKVNLIVEPKLNYLYPHEASPEKCEQLLSYYVSFFQATLKEDTIIHFHNLNLGKNPVLSYAIYQILHKGWTVFHHCHDFSEDRPDNYSYLKQIVSNFFCDDLTDVMYPDMPNYHIATINRIDQARLPASISSERSFYLPNAIDSDINFDCSVKQANKQKVCAELGADPSKLLITYPVRVIERKNIGECALLAKVFSNEATFAVTQPPKNPDQIRQYEAWKNFCSKHSIPLIFEAGTKTNFFSLLNGSDFCISTSRREGFGMAFLEPWLFATPVIGRNLPAVTSDFIDEGMKLDCLYENLLVEGKDFEQYTDIEQMELIEKLDYNDLLKENSFIGLFLDKLESEVIEHNSAIIKTEYSLDNYGKKLYGIYSKMLRNS